MQLRVPLLRVPAEYRAAMARAVLHDDPAWVRRGATGVASTTLDDGDCDDCAPEPFNLNPILVVRQRTRIGFTDDGDPEFDWTHVVTGPAVFWEEHEELDEIAGICSVTATATVLYPGPTEVTESALVKLEGGPSYRVSSVGQWPDRLEFELLRLAGDTHGAE